jgi:hypothetical protein
MTGPEIRKIAIITIIRYDKISAVWGETFVESCINELGDLPLSALALEPCGQ